MKRLFNKYLSTLSYFYTYLRSKVVLLLSLSMLVAIFDGVGLSMFIPLLGKATNSNLDYSNQMGHLNFIIDGFSALGVNFTLGGVLLLIAILLTMKGILRYLQDYYLVRLRLIFMKAIRFQLLEGLANVKYSEFISMNVGKVQNNMTGEVHQVVMAFEHYFRAAQGFAMMLIYILLAFVASPQFAFLVLLAGLASNYLYVRIFRRTKKLSLKVSLLGHTFQNLLIQNINHFKYLKATGRIHQYKMKLKDRIVDIENAQLRLGKLNAILFGSRETIASIIVILVIFVKVSLLGGAITAMLLSLIFFYRALSSVFTVQNNWNSYLGYSGSMEEVRKFSVELSKKQEERRGTKSLNQLQSIQLRNLSYSYAEGPLVIDSVDLEIRAGETIALVGESGSGKSTLVNLISALLDNYEGQILLNNEDLKLWEQESWHGKIGYIAQEAVVFDDSIANNINFWSNENTEESRTRLESVIQKSAIHNYVAGLKKGTDSLLGYNGVSMSVGQKQRISIAREIYKTGLELMIFDEATSALDSHTEQIIKENLERMRGSCIMILIAHRLATIRNADRIVLMDKGAVSAIGSFEELINSSPKFRSMVELQEF